jgi:hypothetical protein
MDQYQMKDMPEPGEKSVPKWAKALFHDFLQKEKRLSDVLHLAIGGIHMVRTRHQALKTIAEHLPKEEGDPADPSDHPEVIRAAKDKELADREIEYGFPILYEQATIALWTSLDTLVRVFLANWLLHTPEARQCNAVKKLKVKLGDYESLEPPERCLWIIDVLDQELGGPLRAGTTRFETLLQPFGFSGSFDNDYGRALFELWQVRNALVHRNGIVDRKLLEACPWLKFSLGVPLYISHSMWMTYQAAVTNYVLELVQRIRVHFGLIRYEQPPVDSPTDELPPINSDE